MSSVTVILLRDHSVGCTTSTIVGRSDSLGVLLPHIVRRRGGPRTVISALFDCPPVGAGSTPPFISRGTTPSPSLPVIPVLSFPLPIPVINTFPLTLTAATRATRPLTRPIGRGWRPPIPIVAPNRRWWIFGPLDAQTVSIKAPSMHVVVGVLGVTSASEFDKGITGSREWFVERSSFDGIGLGRGMIVTCARNDGKTKRGRSPSSSAPDRKIERADHLQQSYRP